MIPAITAAAKPPATKPNIVTLTIGGKAYSGWTEISITRGIERCVSSFRVTGADITPGPIAGPFDACVVKIDGDLVLTGYVEEVEVDFDADKHTVRITGHSKTKDLVECVPDIASGQFLGFSVAQIARAICGLFGINVVVQSANADQVVQNTNLNRAETAFRFLERMANLAGVLLTDDQNGNLVLTDAGQTTSKTKLVQGTNILSARVTYNSSKRFSNYIVKGQSSIGGGSPLNLDGAGGISSSVPVGTIQNAMRAEAVDSAVPRYRPHVTLAESQLTLQQMQERANWQLQYAFGQSMKATVRIAGFRQQDGTLWTSNLMATLTAPWLYVANNLLIVEVTFALDSSKGHVTELRLGPVQGYTPDPGSVKLVAGKKGKAGKPGVDWTGAGGS